MAQMLLHLRLGLFSGSNKCVTPISSAFFNGRGPNFVAKASFIECPTQCLRYVEGLSEAMQLSDLQLSARGFHAPEAGFTAFGCGGSA
jgi:hypothetical protein